MPLKFNDKLIAIDLPTYNVTVLPSSNGTVTASPSSGVPGTIVSLSNTPDQGYVLDRYQLTGSSLIDGDKFMIKKSNVTVQPSFIPESVVLWNDNTEYYRTPSSTAKLSLNKSLPSEYGILVFKFDSKWKAGTANFYDMRLTISANNKTFSQRLCSPVGRSYVPVAYNGNSGGIAAFGGSYNTELDLQYGVQTNDWYLANKITNNNYYTNKIIYSNFDNSLRYYMPNNGGYIFEATNLTKFETIQEITFSGNSGSPAYVYLKDMSVMVTNNIDIALSY